MKSMNKEHVVWIPQKQVSTCISTSFYLFFFDVFYFKSVDKNGVDIFLKLSTYDNRRV